MILRIANAVMAVLFAVGAAVQINDPDPLGWIAIYGFACAAAVLQSVRGAVPLVLPIAVGLAALIAGAAVAAAQPAFEPYRHMFGAWEMESAAIEEAREASGLFLIAFWMAVLSWTGRRVTRGAGSRLSR